MKYRKLRIAFSVTCGIACVLLVVLWFRSYYARSSHIIFTRSQNRWVHIISTDSRLRVAFATQNFFAIQQLGLSNAATPSSPGNHWVLNRLLFTEPGDGDIPKEHRKWPVPATTIKLIRYVDGLLIEIGYPFAVLVTVALAAAPWMRRFSLRTMLIATTLLAVLLGTSFNAAR